MGDARIMIVVSDAEAGNAYAAALSGISATCDKAGSFREMAAMATETPYSGLIIDLPTLVRCSKEEKVIAYDCINLFPVLRVKWESRQNKINVSPLENHNCHDVESAFRYFIENVCSSFHARTIRKHKRKQVNLSALLCPDESFADQNTRKTFTVTLSKGGVFVYTMEEWRQDAPLWLRFIESRDQTPVPAVVRWSQKWGVSRSIPGIGMSFGELEPRLEKEIECLLK